MGILADQAMQRLRNVVAQERERAGETATVISGGNSAAWMRAAIIGAAFLVLASAVFFAQPNAGPNSRTVSETDKRAVVKGRAAFPLADGVTCRELVFDRVKGDIVDSNTAPCDSISRKAYVEPDRNSTSTGFSWGRR